MLKACGLGPLFANVQKASASFLYSCSQSVRILVFSPLLHFIAHTHSSGISAQNHLMQEVTSGSSNEKTILLRVSCTRPRKPKIHILKSELCAVICLPPQYAESTLTAEGVPVFRT